MTEEERVIESGEKEIVIASEKVQVQNIMTMIGVIKDLRSDIHRLEEELKRMKNNFLTLQNEYQEQKRQLSILQGRFYAAGTVRYGD